MQTDALRHRLLAEMTLVLRMAHAMARGQYMCPDSLDSNYYTSRISHCTGTPAFRHSAHSHQRCNCRELGGQHKCPGSLGSSSCVARSARYTGKPDLRRRSRSHIHCNLHRYPGSRGSSFHMSCSCHYTGTTVLGRNFCYHNHTQGKCPHAPDHAIAETPLQLSPTRGKGGSERRHSTSHGLPVERRMVRGALGA